MNYRNFKQDLRGQELSTHQEKIGLIYSHPLVVVADKKMPCKDFYCPDNGAYIECKTDKYYATGNFCIELATNLSVVPDYYDYDGCLEILRELWKKNSNLSIGLYRDLSPLHFLSYLFADGTHYWFNAHLLKEFILDALKAKKYRFNIGCTADSGQCWYSVNLLVPRPDIGRI
jgi:hypothetical protein